MLWLESWIDCDNVKDIPLEHQCLVVSFRREHLLLDGLPLFDGIPLVDGILLLDGLPLLNGMWFCVIFSY